ncbi:hypothetical protein RUM44_013740 [Polyplax serrata]|uniref:Uncharacterized protein n=1 Tax=Polyplax serrata TaxID=468196 RepID=A0ABR1BIN6_POLSC
MLKCPSMDGDGPQKLGNGLPSGPGQYTFSSPPRAVMVTRKMYRNPPLKELVSVRKFYFRVKGFKCE